MKEKVARTTFLIFLIILLAAFVWIIRPFLVPGLLSILIVVICDPVYQICLRWVKQRRYIASSLATSFVVLCIILPLGIIGGIVAYNGVELVGNVISQLEGGQLAKQIDSLGSQLTAKIKEMTNLVPADFDLRAALLRSFNMIGSIIYQYSPRVITATLTVLTDFIFMVIFVFVLFVEGSTLFRAIISLIPLSEQHKEILIKELRSVITTTVLGLIVTAFIQGILIGIGFWIVGISKPLAWGIVAIGVSLIPFIGAAILYVPASAYLMLTGHWMGGIFMLVYGFGGVSLVDNIVKPLLMRGRVDVHPLLLALSIIGGGIWLGMTGIILGPMIVVLMLAMLDIYRREFA